MKKKEKIFKSTLPAKITGIVFWGMVFLGIISAFALLKKEEHALINEQKKNSQILFDAVQMLIEKEGLDVSENYLLFELSPLIKAADANGIQIHYRNHEYLIGTNKGTQIERKLNLQSNQINVTLYFTEIQTVIEEKRKNFILIIGLGVIVFGLLLQRILQLMIAEPFNKMIGTARIISNGDSSRRFDMNRTDEFGFLGKFINESLNTILEKQTDLKEALDRAVRSENDLYSEKERAEVTLNSIADAVISTDSRGIVNFINPAGLRLLRLTEQEAKNRHIDEVISIIDETTEEKLPNPFYRSVEKNTALFFSDHCAIRTEEENVAVEISAAPMKNHNGMVIGCVLVLQDVSQTRLLTSQLKFHASHDALTGLFNRRKFEERLNELIQSLDSASEHVLFYMDLDQFKIVNDTSGHMAGDELLKQLAGVIQANVRRGDILARLGGDEFGILLENCPLEKALPLAEKIRDSIRNFRFIWNDKNFEIGSSTGIVSITMKNSDYNEIMSSADLACYAAKEQGRNRIHIFESSDEALAKKHGEMHWANQITHSLENNLFALYQQPIINIRNPSEKKNHSEILLRMKDQKGKIILPDQFISAAERYGLMWEVDQWVIRNVFRYMISPHCCKIFPEDARMVSINLSGASIANEELVSYIQSASEKYYIDLNEICFEITETAAISNITKATHAIHELKKLGCRFALDDFGTGLSSFEYLKTLPVDYIKIDGAFIKNITSDPIDKAMVETIARVGHIMDIEIIAEWVGDESTLQLIRQVGLDFAQGHYMGQPEPLPGSWET